MPYVSLEFYKGKLLSFTVKKMSIEIGSKEAQALKNLFSNDETFEGHVKIVNTYDEV